VLEGKRSKLSSALSGIQQHKWEIVGVIVLLVGIWGLVKLYRGGIKSIGGLPLADWVVLFVGLIAFVAVMIQIEEQQNTRKEEERLKRISVPNGILCEVNSFYLYYIQPSLGVMRTRGHDDHWLVKSVDQLHFWVFEMVGDEIGSFPADLAWEIVDFYWLATICLDNLREYRLALLNADSVVGIVIDWKAQSVQARERLVPTLPCLALKTYTVCEALCSFLGVPFNAARVAVASENKANIEAECRKAKIVRPLTN
jgi:hypothetical protein